MISNNIKKAKITFPAVQSMGGPSFLGRIKLKNIYQQWNGESFSDIAKRHKDNPFTMRIGLPQTDKQMKEDRIFLFTKYLAYNPLTKQVEKRELIPLRNTEKIYIGHSPEEHQYKDYKLFVDGKVVLEDVIFKSPNHIDSLVQTLEFMKLRIETLENEIANLKQKIFISNEQFSTISSRESH